MLELLLILAVVVYLVSKLDKHHFEQASSQAGLRTSPDRAATRGRRRAPRCGSRSKAPSGPICAAPDS